MARNAMEDRIRSAVDSFVAEISSLVREAALETIADAFGEKPKAARPRVAAARPGRPPGRPPARRKKKGGRRVRRSSASVDATADRVAAHVAANPGVSISEIGAALGLDTTDLRLPVQKLQRDGKVRTTGQKRGTRYFAGRGGGGAAKKAGRRKKKAGRKKATRR